MRGIIVFSYLLAFVVSSFELAACDDDSSLNRVYSDVDESSCICGLNKDLLDKLELILNSSKATCSISTSSTHIYPNYGQQQQQHVANRTDPESNRPDPFQSKDDGNAGADKDRDRDRDNASNSRDPSSSSQDNQAQQQPNRNDDDNDRKDNLADQIQSLQSQLANLMALSNNKNPPREPETFPTPSSSHTSSTSNPPSPSAPSSSSSSSLTSYDPYSRPSSQQSTDGPAFNEHGGHGQGSSSNNNNNNHDDGFDHREEPKRPQSHQINSGFLGGLPVLNPTTSESNALSKLNNSQKVDSSDMQSALELTVPNVVSNIFSNIQNLTIETEKNPNGAGQVGSGQPDKLTSIDGSSVNVSGSSSEQIQAQGEQLFVEWIDHQLQSLHLTASVAAYIHKNAILLFRRIVKQYVEQVEKLGGRVEDNVRRATQIALNNTQNLISFLLKNYLNFAGGLMRIIGEQVSRVGKQLDSTGETIAHINLNPFDIVSNVIDSLPNPSRYSEYFRAFGKYLMGESQSDQQAASQGGGETSATSPGQQSEGGKKGGLFSKTMGALSKTLGSWLG